MKPRQYSYGRTNSRPGRLHTSARTLNICGMLTRATTTIRPILKGPRRMYTRGRYTRTGLWADGKRKTEVTRLKRAGPHMGASIARGSRVYTSLDAGTGKDRHSVGLWSTGRLWPARLCCGVPHFNQWTHLHFWCGSLANHLSDRVGSPGCTQ